MVGPPGNESNGDRSLGVLESPPMATDDFFRVDTMIDLRDLILVSVQVELINPRPCGQATQGRVAGGEPWQSELKLLSNAG